MIGISWLGLAPSNPGRVGGNKTVTPGLVLGLAALWYGSTCVVCACADTPSNTLTRINHVNSHKYHISLNQRCPRIVAVASKRGTRTHEQMISDDSHHASTRTVCVVRVIPTADSRTERLRVLLTVSSNHHRLTRTYLIQPPLMSPDFPRKYNVNATLE